MGMMPDTAKTLVFTNAAEVARCTGPAVEGDSADPAAALARGAVAVRDGVITDVDAEDAVLGRWPDAERVDCGGRVLTPSTRRARGRTSGLAFEQSVVLIWEIRDGLSYRLHIFATEDDAREAFGS